jgi:hypothetical protein
MHCYCFIVGKKQWVVERVTKVTIKTIREQGNIFKYGLQILLLLLLCPVTRIGCLNECALSLGARGDMLLCCEFRSSSELTIVHLALLVQHISNSNKTEQFVCT